MAQADDIKALQEQVKGLTARLEASETLATDLVKRLEILENAEPTDNDRIAAVEDRVEKIRAFVNAPA